MAHLLIETPDGRTRSLGIIRPQVLSSLKVQASIAWVSLEQWISELLHADLDNVSSPIEPNQAPRDSEAITIHDKGRACSRIESMVRCWHDLWWENATDGIEQLAHPGAVQWMAGQPNKPNAATFYQHAPRKKIGGFKNGEEG